MPLARSEQPRYQAYLLRLWETRSGRSGCPSTWRFSLQDVETRQESYFADLEAVVAFLRAAMERYEDGPAPVLTAEQ